MGQKVLDTQEQCQKDIQKTLKELEEGNFQAAQSILTAGYMYNLESREIDTTELYCSFWLNKLSDFERLNGPYERGQRLFLEWKAFLRFIESKPINYPSAVDAIKRGVFLLATAAYNEILNEGNNINDYNPKRTQEQVELLTKLGICLKARGLYEDAAQKLVAASKLSATSSLVMAHLADCYALCGSDRAAKALFREAFLEDARAIDLDFLDSALIKDLINDTKAVLKAEGKVVPPSIFNEWVAVVGVVFGVFNIKRVLGAKDIARLRQEIYSLEQDQKDPSRATSDAVPRLLNLYFRLIDYCQGHDERLVSETLLKVRILDRDIYDQFVGQDSRR